MDWPVPHQDPDVVTAVAPSVSEALGPRFNALFEAELRYVWTSLGRLGVAERDREDLANEVFFRVHRHLADYDPARPVRPWLFAFAVRVASEHRRLSRNRYESLGLAGDAGPSAAAAMRGGSEERELVMRALDRLDMDKRAVFVMHFVDGFSVPEIARALAIPEGTAYSRLRAGREAFTTAVRQLQRGTP